MEESEKKQLMQDRGRNHMIIRRTMSRRWIQEKRVKINGKQLGQGDAIVVGITVTGALEDTEEDIEVVDGAVKETDRVKATILVKTRAVDTHLEAKTTGGEYEQEEE